MTTNFERVSSNTETDKRVSIDSGNRSHCDDRLTQNQRIDSSWPLASAAAMMPSKKASPPAEDIETSQKQHMGRKRKRLDLDAGKTQLFPQSGTSRNCSEASGHAVSTGGRSFAPLHNNDFLEDDFISTLKEIIEPIPLKTIIASDKQSLNYWDNSSTIPTIQRHQEYYETPYHYQRHNQHFNRQLQNHELNQHRYSFQKSEPHIQQEYRYPSRQQNVNFSCLYPRDDQRSRVRFSSSLSIYDKFEDFDYKDDIHDNLPKTNCQKAIGKSKESYDCGSFLLNRARHCWYSKEDLKVIKNERRVIVRILKKVNFDIGAIDKSIYELRGFEAYMSVSSFLSRSFVIGAHHYS